MQLGYYKNNKTDIDRKLIQDVKSGKKKIK